ncbi:MAG TPA: DNA double-strand break repair nuclease NurA [Anaerolineae bacterium]|nr:DNA double-strand break repair nuclease NurA [Anaerolineae bacterium]
MTLELSQVAQQVKAMGRSLAAQQPAHAEAVRQAQTLLTEFSTRFSELHERIQQAERVQQTQRFDWVGAAPVGEPLADRYPLPACPEQLTVIASDGSQILPDPHAITLYYLINTGSIVYRHGSSRKPELFRPSPQLFFEPADLFDEQGRLITAGEVHAQRDLAELNCLVNVAPAFARDYGEPVVALSDGQLTLRVIDLPFNQQEIFQDQYLAMLDTLRQANVTVAGYIDRPRSTFVLSLLHLASLALEQIAEETLRLNPFRYLTDSELFVHLAPGERSAIFATRAKGLDKYTYTGHAIHFFYLNVSANDTPRLARVEIPAWVVGDPEKLDTLHAGIVRQARLTGGYPYVLARADELAVISSEERQVVETMLTVELRRQGFAPEISLKQRNKNAFRFGREYL